LDLSIVPGERRAVKVKKMGFKAPVRSRGR